MKPKTGYRMAFARAKTENNALRKSMHEMLDAFWGEGDGDRAPDFIRRAARLSRWKAPAGSLEGNKTNVA